MKKLSYLEKFTLAARWILPQGEAKEVIDDYRHILKDMSGDEEAAAAFGSPKKAVLALTDEKKLRRWHRVFLALCVLALLPAVVNVLYVEFLYLNYEFLTNALIASLLLGVGVSLLRKCSLAKPITIGLGVLLGVLVFLCFLFNISWMLHIPSFYGYHVYGAAAVLGVAWFGFGRMKNQEAHRPFIPTLLLTFLCLGSIYGLTTYSIHTGMDGFARHVDMVYVFSSIGMALFAVLAVASLVCARMFHRRWRSVFVLALCGLLMCMQLREICFGMVRDPNVEVFVGAQGLWTLEMISHWFTRYFCFGTVLALLGLL